MHRKQDGVMRSGTVAWISVLVLGVAGATFAEATGDANRDGAVDAADVALTMRVASGLTATNDPGFDLANADMDSNLTITLDDAIIISIKGKGGGGQGSHPLPAKKEVQVDQDTTESVQLEGGHAVTGTAKDGAGESLTRLVDPTTARQGTVTFEDGSRETTAVVQADAVYRAIVAAGRQAVKVRCIEISQAPFNPLILREFSTTCDVMPDRVNVTGDTSLDLVVADTSRRGSVDLSIDGGSMAVMNVGFRGPGISSITRGYFGELIAALAGTYDKAFLEGRYSGDTERVINVEMDQAVNLLVGENDTASANIVLASLELIKGTTTGDPNTGHNRVVATATIGGSRPDIAEAAGQTYTSTFQPNSGSREVRFALPAGPATVTAQREVFLGGYRHTLAVDLPYTVPEGGADNVEFPVPALPETFRVSGQVTGPGGQPQRATIAYRTLNPTTGEWYVSSGGVSTDEDGNHEIDLPAGDYEFTISPI